MTEPTARSYAARAASTGTFGRVLCSAREHHFIIDGPVQNGCPGEELTPPEAFLAGVASCGVELVQVIAREESVPLHATRVEIEGTLDRSRPVREDYTVFNHVRLRFELDGVSQQRAERLVERFKRR